MKTKIKSFTDQNTWKEVHKLIIMIYQITKQFPKEEMYSLVDQMRRAATPITSNFAEVFGRQSCREKIQFYYVPQGSLIELKNQLLISKDIDYLNKVNFDKLAIQANIAHHPLQGLITSSKSINESHKS